LERHDASVVPKTPSNAVAPIADRLAALREARLHDGRVEVKRQFSLEALYAFVFAICVLVALFLLAG
jgi:hypothetical protein